MNRYENTLPNKIAKRVKASTANNQLNLMALSEIIGVHHTNLWFYFNGKRKWNIETWLDVLAALGALTYERGCIVIKTDLTARERLRFSLYKQRWQKVKRSPNE